VPNLVSTVQGYAAHERGVFEEVTRARSAAQAAQGPGAASIAEGPFMAALGRLFAVVENYPELKANQNFLQLQAALADTEDRIQSSRAVYNGNVQMYNRQVQAFPSNGVAGLFHFERADFFRIAESDRTTVGAPLPSTSATSRREESRRRHPRRGPTHEGERMQYAISVTLNTTYEDAVARVKQALQEQGFGTLTEIDVTATMKEKLRVDTEPYLIIGACNPKLAHAALVIDRQVGLLLPCNVVVCRAGRQTVVHALDAEIIARVAERPELQVIAEDARRRIRAALDALACPVPAAS
jgi:uncharacterized protein (DUF302 family)